MGDLMKEFDNSNFSVDKYTKQLVKECVGGADLQKCKKEIHTYRDQTSATLKRSVYANYMQFIETAKEISHLESEMTQMSLLLQEQHNILSSLTEGNASKDISGHSEKDMTTSEENENVHASRAIKEMVQNYTGKLDGKTFLYEGALMELDNNDYRPIQRVFFFLFNDVLIICKIKHDKKLEFMADYDPKKIAVINIKDLDGVKNAINIITPAGSKIFQSITAAGKTEWIEKLEVAFRWDQPGQKSKKGPAPQPPKRKSQETPISSKHTSVDLSPISVQIKVAENFGPEWITTANEEVQTLIAQRHFEDAECLIKRCQEYLAHDKTFVNALEIEECVHQLEKQLTEVLLKELSQCHAQNLQVALRSSRRCSQILVNMGKARQACGTLLRVCSIALRTSQREARRNNSEISELFFCDLAQVACEFINVFENQPACVSGKQKVSLHLLFMCFCNVASFQALVVWCNAELQYFANQLKKHYLTKGSHLEAIAKCVEGVRKPCAKLTEIGLDLSYHLEGLLRADLDELIKKSRARLLETIGRTEDIWQPYNLQTKTNLRRLLLEFDNLGVDMRVHATGDTWINLTQSTVNFTKHFLQVVNHCAHLAKSEALSPSCQILLSDLIQAQHAIKPTTGLSVDPNFVAKNKQFLVEELLPKAINKFHEISGNAGELLLSLQQQMRKQHAPIPKRRNVYQTDVF
uniref:Exocyst complex component 8 n=1 Tax=Glossina brevipalpis TaxID=37001 RepID=A0A1A9WLN5_9MUSC